MENKKATQVQFWMDLQTMGKAFWVEGTQKGRFFVKSVEAGKVFIHTELGSMRKTAQIMAGCLAEESNFLAELAKAYEGKIEKVESICFKMENVTVFVTQQTAEPESILEERKYQRAKVENLARLMREDSQAENIRFIIEETSFLWRNPQDIEKWEEIRSRDSDLVEFAEYWAKLMQYWKEQYTVKISTIEKKASIAVGQFFKMNSSLYCCARDLLIAYWHYGDMLKL